MNFDAINKKETLAEKVANTIKEAIIQGEIKAGESLPTEPELAAQFNVSRAVIRDASRILMAWGLIEILHGKGMYVTEEMSGYFVEAILTILRREGASTWEMQEYEQLILPEVFGLAAEHCTDKQRTELEKRGEAYIEFIRTGSDNAVVQKELFFTFMETVFEATGNRVLSLMGKIQQLIRELRHITGDEGREKDLQDLEEKSIRLMIDAVQSGDSDSARQLISKIYSAGPKTQEIMRRVPLGGQISIPVDVFFEEMGF